MRAQKIEIISWTPGQVLTDMSWPRAKESVETVEPSFLWMFAQPPMALIGLVLRKNDFGKAWDGGEDLLDIAVHVSLSFAVGALSRQRGLLFD